MIRSKLGFRLRHLREKQNYLYDGYHRTMAIYAVGEGWTGALTREHILKTISGQHDEEATNYDKSNEKTSNLPVVIYPYDDIQQATAGWGVSAFLDTQGSFRIVGRPHDLVSLLRMNRMPPWLQRWINRNHDTSLTTPVGSMISNLIGWATGSLSDIPEEKETWRIAEKFSLLDDWTKVDNNSMNKLGSKGGKADTRIKQVACGPGFLAFVEESGALYTMGVNNRGQCGTGTTSNNIWIPEPVRGLSMTTLPIGGGDKISDKIASEQDQPIVQVALGFQHGFALSKDGQVYSWGKASRGQLGRTVDSDQDPWARPIKIDGDKRRVVEIDSGFFHGALKTDDGKVFIWGKNMSREAVDSSGSDGDEEPISIATADLRDAQKPEQVFGLPTTNDNETMKVQRISCGSHHTAMLMDDGSVFAVGIASDEAIPILDPVELIPSGVLELPIRHFEAHHDRTSVVDNKGMVYQVHLWNDETLQDYAYFIPSYVDTLLDQGQTIQSIHRGWRHTMIVTEDS
jgi:alpha-tubulin suppressor-like RCC1 family protein